MKTGDNSNFVWYMTGGVILGIIAILTYVNSAYASCDRVTANEKRVDDLKAEIREARAEFKDEQKETRLQIREQCDEIKKMIGNK